MFKMLHFVKKFILNLAFVKKEIDSVHSTIRYLTEQVEENNKGAKAILNESIQVTDTTIARQNKNLKEKIKELESQAEKLKQINFSKNQEINTLKGNVSN